MLSGGTELKPGFPPAWRRRVGVEEGAQSPRGGRCGELTEPSPSQPPGGPPVVPDPGDRSHGANGPLPAPLVLPVPLDLEPVLGWDLPSRGDRWHPPQFFRGEPWPTPKRLLGACGRAAPRATRGPFPPPAQPGPPRGSGFWGGGLVAALWDQVASLQPHQECGSEGDLGLLGLGGCDRDFVVAAAAGKIEGRRAARGQGTAAPFPFGAWPLLTLS